MQSENLYILLDVFQLDDPHCGFKNDEAGAAAFFKQKINEAKATFSAQQSGSGKKAVFAGKALAVLRNAEEKVSTPEQREEIYHKAHAEIRKKLAAGLSLFQKRELEVVEVEHIAKQLGLNPELAKRFATEVLSLKIVAGTREAKKLPQPKGASKLRRVHEGLRVHKVENFYELLFADQKDKRGVLSSKELVSLADHMLKGLQRGKQTDEKTVKQNALTLAKTQFKTESGREAYDQFLAWEKMMAVLKELETQAVSSKHLNRSQSDEAVKKLIKQSAIAGSPISQSDAVDYIDSYLRDHQLSWARPEEEVVTEDLNQCVLCRLVIPKGAQVCPECGGKQTIECPKCGASSPGDSRHCVSCGFDYGARSRVETLLVQARIECRQLHLAEASTLIDQAEEIWPGYAEAQQARNELAAVEKTAGATKEALDRAIQEKKNIEAKRHYERLTNLVPGFSDSALLEQIDQDIEIARQRIAQAQGKPEDERIKLVLSAYDRCADLPEVLREFSALQPQAPTQVNVAVDARSGSNRISWTVPTGKVQQYVVLRKARSISTHPDDGEVLAVVTQNEFVDDTPSYDTAYFYSVYARLGPQASQLATHQDPALNLKEAVIESVVGGAEKVEAKWRVPEVAIDVIASRYVDNPANATEVTNSNLSQMLDVGLTNDQKYTYVVQVVYRVSGEEVKSRGVTFTATPAQPPTPVDWIIADIIDAKIHLTWDVPDKGDVVFALAKTLPALHAGEVLSAETFAKNGWLKADVQVTGEGEGVLEIEQDALYHLLAFTVVGRQYVFGASTAVSSR